MTETLKEISIRVNKQSYTVTSLHELEVVLNQHSQVEFAEYLIEGHGETAIVLLINSSNSLAVYFRQEGDSGFTTTNPSGEEEKTQDFVLANGQGDSYSENMLVTRRQGIEILKHYLLTGEMDPKVEWKEE